MLTVGQVKNRLKDQPDELPFLIQLQSGVVLSTEALALSTVQVGENETPVIVILSKAAKSSDDAHAERHLEAVEDENDDE